MSLFPFVASDIKIFNESILYEKIKKLNKNDPIFAYYSAIHFMRALLQISTNFELKPSIEKIQALSIDEKWNHTYDYFTSYLMSLNFIQTLSTYRENKDKSIYFTREAIVTWYYAVYHSLHAVIKSFNNESNGTDTHRGAINIFTSNIHNYYPKILNYTVKNLNIYEENINNYMKEINISRYDICKKPNNYSESVGAYFSYFKGTCKYIKWLEEDRLKKKHKFENYRKKNAQEIRDNILKEKTCSFYD